MRFPNAPSASSSDGLHARVQGRGVGQGSHSTLLALRRSTGRNGNSLQRPSSIATWIRRSFLEETIASVWRRSDPHTCPTKLVFNTRELPLTGLVLMESGCVHAYRTHAVCPVVHPSKGFDGEGVVAGREHVDLGEWVPELFRRWTEALLGEIGPERLIRAVARYSFSLGPVQEVWALAFEPTATFPFRCRSSRAIASMMSKLDSARIPSARDGRRDSVSPLTGTVPCTFPGPAL